MIIILYILYFFSPSLTQYVAKWMIDNGKGGAIVNVSSMASKVALKDHTSYCEYWPHLSLYEHVHNEHMHTTCIFLHLSQVHQKLH